ncbi:MAG: dephospho-CoA kinase, partial [Planctomycetaceae bacterium]|nr:dephospho-CoA kinase [Planctomycetaceae bacterium]
DLNRIVHPLIKKQIQQEILEAREKARREPGSVSGVVLDAALLLETGWGDMCDAIVFVDASTEVREKRVRETRGWHPEDWEKREASQFSLKEKQHAADITINNSQDLELAIDELEKFFASQFSADQSSLRSDA